MCKAIEDMKEDARNAGQKDERNNGMIKFIGLAKKFNSSRDVAIHELSEAYAPSSEEAMAFVYNHW